jgi:hypothetical protein
MDGRGDFILDRGDRKAYLKAKHLGKLRIQLLHTCAEAQ